MVLGSTTSPTVLKVTIWNLQQSFYFYSIFYCYSYMPGINFEILPYTRDLVGFVSGTSTVFKVKFETCSKVKI